MDINCYLVSVRLMIIISYGYHKLTVCCEPIKFQYFVQGNINSLFSMANNISFGDPLILYYNKTSHYSKLQFILGATKDTNVFPAHIPNSISSTKDASFL